MRQTLIVLATLGLMMAMHRRVAAQPTVVKPPSESPSGAPGEPLLNDKETLARSHFNAATKLYEAGQFRLAAAEFEEAYLLSVRPEVLYNLYAAYRDAGDTEKAAFNLRAYLDKVPDAPDRVQLESRLRALDKLNDQRKQQTAAAKAATQPSSEKSPHPIPKPEESSGSFTHDVLPWLFIGAGALAIAGGSVTGLIALDKTSDIEANCPNDVCPSEYDLARDRDSARTLSTTTDVLLIGGALLAATGVGLLLFLDDDDENPADNLSAVCAPGYCGAQYKGSF